jgi:hypothetical protein
MEKPDGVLSTRYGRTEIVTLKERHPSEAEYIDRRIERYLLDESVPSSDDEFVQLLRNQLEPRVPAASLRPMKGKKERGSRSRRP